MVKFSPHDHNYDAVLGRLVGLAKKAAAAEQDLAQESSPKLSSDQRKRLIDLLSFDQIDERLVNLKPPKTNTCKWILQNLEYRTWIDTSTMSSEHYRLLWIKGKPGAGKSIIMKHLFQQKTKVPGAKPISFFFNARGNVLERSTLGLYRALLLQLFQKNPDLQDSLEILGFYGTNMAEWRLQSLKNVLLETVRMLKSQVFCYIDALDECPEAEIRDMISFFHEIRDAATSSRRNFYVCFSSRHYPQISVEKSLQILLEKQPDHELDIEHYINTELHIGKSDQATQVKHDIKDKASGVFLWVALVVPMLNQVFDHGNFKALTTLLKDLPPNLENLIKDILTRDKSNMDALLCCLQWVLFSSKPLQLPTLYFAIKGALDYNDYNERLRWNRNEEFESMDMMFRFVLSASKGLVEETKSENPTMQFIHESVRDFLIRNKGLQELWPQLGPRSEARSHHLLAQYCIKQIESPSLNNTAPTTSPPTLGGSSGTRPSLGFSRSKSISSFPFLIYAIENVLYHLNQAQAHNEDQMQFIDQFPKHQWIRYHSLLREYKEYHKHNFTRDFGLQHPFYDEYYPEDINLLYILAKLDLVHLIRLLPDRIRHLDIVGGLHRTPLVAALACGSKEAARDLGFQVFIDQGVLIHNTQECEDYFSSLIPKTNLIPREDDTIETLLLQHQCFPTINALILQRTDQDNSSIFSEALRFKVWKTLELLIEKGSNIEAVERDSSTPLLVAAAAAMRTKFGPAGLVKKLLALGANIEATDKRGRTPLLAAADTGRSANIVKQLLDKGANIETIDKYGRTPLLAAAGSYSHPLTKIIKQLLDKGANIEATDKRGRTPLLAAVDTGLFASIVEQLLDKGANIEARDEHGRTPLLAVAKTFEDSTFNVIKQLLDKGANIEARDEHGRTPLLAAAGAAAGAAAIREVLPTLWPSPAETIEELLERGANIEAGDKNGRTPLLVAVAAAAKEELPLEPHTDTIEILLEKGANIEAIDKNGHTPLLLVKDLSSRTATRVAELLHAYQQAGSGL
jgi:ankyrin repeat protein